MKTMISRSYLLGCLSLSIGWTEFGANDGGGTMMSAIVLGVGAQATSGIVNDGQVHSPPANKVSTSFDGPLTVDSSMKEVDDLLKLHDDHTTENHTTGGTDADAVGDDDGTATTEHMISSLMEGTQKKHDHNEVDISYYHLRQNADHDMMIDESKEQHDSTSSSTNSAVAPSSSVHEENQITKNRRPTNSGGETSSFLPSASSHSPLRGGGRKRGSSSPIGKNTIPASKEQLNEYNDIGSSDFTKRLEMIAREGQDEAPKEEITVLEEDYGDDADLGQVTYYRDDHDAGQDQFGQDHRFLVEDPVARTYIVSEDSYIRGGNYANSNFGNSLSMVVKKDSPTYTRIAVLRFGGLNGPPVEKAVLMLYVVSVNTNIRRDITVLKLKEPSSWTETGVTWSNLDIEANIEEVGPTFPVYHSDKHSWLQIDISSLLVDHPHDTLTIALQNRGSASSRGDCQFASKERTSDGGYQPRLVVADTSPVQIAGDFINFAQTPILSFQGQDAASSTATVEDDGATLFLRGNAWKAVEIQGKISRDTVLEFDFSSEVRGEGHVVGFSKQPHAAYSSDAEKHGFYLYGTQQFNHANRDFNNYSPSVPGEWKHYSIPVGEYYQGDISYLYVANDQDASGSSVAESRVRNVWVGPSRYTQLRSADNIEKCIDLWGGNTAEGTSIITYQCHHGRNMYWHHDSTSGFLRSKKDPNKCATALSLDSGSLVELYTCDPSNELQKWVRTIDKTLALRASNPLRCLDVPDHGAVNHAMLKVTTCNGSTLTQKFRPLEAMMQHAISPQHPDLKHQCLEVDTADASVPSGTDIKSRKCNGSDKQQWLYDAETGLIHSLYDPTTCIDLAAGNKSRGAKIVMWPCRVGSKNQMWFVFNNMIHLADDRNFVIDNSFANPDSIHLYTSHGNTNQRFAFGNEDEYYPDAVRSQHDRTRCLQPKDAQTSVGTRLEFKTCNGSTAQQWKYTSGKLQSVLGGTNRCINTSGSWNNGTPLVLSYCTDHQNNRYEYKDGSIRLEGNDSLVMDWDPNTNTVRLWTYFGKTEQRFLVQHSLDDDTVSDGAIRIRNNSNFPAECSLGQVGPLYWGVIYPGEEFYRYTGKVHFTVKCRLVLDGQETLTVWDAVLPVADIVLTICLAFATAGMAGVNAISAATANTIKVAGKGAIAAITQQSVVTVVRAMAFKYGTIQLKKNVLIQTVKQGVKSKIMSSSIVQGGQNVVKKITAMIGSSSSSTAPSAVGTFVKSGLGEALEATLVKSLVLSTEEAYNALFSPDNTGASKSNVYANGKYLILSGGVSFQDPLVDDFGDTVDSIKMLDPTLNPAEVAILQHAPLVIGNYYGLFDEAVCNNNDGCLKDSCAYLQRGDDVKQCCPTGDDGYFGGHYYCIQQTEPGNSCWFDDQCIDGFCSTAGSGPDTCAMGFADGEECQFDTECMSRYCRGNAYGLGTGTCTARKPSGSGCSIDSECLSDACGRDSATIDNSGEDYICCPSGDTVTVSYEYCTAYRQEGQSCKHDEMCISGFCHGSNGMGWVGQCYTPKDDYEECMSDGNDRSCKSGSCALDGVDGKYVCCPQSLDDPDADLDGDYATLEYCLKMVDTDDECWFDGQCKSGQCYCGSDVLCQAGTSPGTCMDTNVAKGESCPSTDDSQCTGSLKCGKKSALSTHSDEYICCDAVYTPAGWTTDVCKNQRSKGQSCEYDNDCSGSECARENADDNTKLTCCQSGNSVYNGANAKYYCTEMPDGTRCWLDSMCKNDSCSGNLYGLQRGYCD